MDWNFISTVKRHVENNIDNQSFNVETLCSLMGMSRTSFYNKLKSLTDQAPADYIRLIRLEYAIRLLKEGEHNITEISEMTGFNDARYFRQVFKKHFNVSPSQYGKKIREHR
ncbi:HTH-type transcriptional activator Btr [Bacteroides pyogenes]|jgi:AraC-like DNA-binding protein|uniref:Helix-turn-helix transcriptional regulator n=3 Tax=Bacteroides pyogenes TaxID=310300 RepID=A0A5D3FRW2_9BACE|nr:HTH-type transcriptional activator Btr [Bacteroides pyogenes]GAE16106.1 para-aminobenzoate synthase [Bacteroides pyogenes JCM 6292]GAE19571.1 putative glycogen debranching enzyme [Bacteroides pyogenes DSM 20611 = JCM 6294]MBR8707253.1 HTH-type transcriptional activator Btr [Bacteroides pyogenes]MBR8717103.1 HTH-type transcriptional activator Btr [Bacteroides pyogenes]